MQCRICFGEGPPGDFVRPCRCSGTMADVHRTCLETSCLYVPDRICRVCRTPFDMPDPWWPRVVFWTMMAALLGAAACMPERLLARVAGCLTLGLLGSLYTRLRLTSLVTPIVVACLWILVYWIDTAASAVAVVGILGGLLAVYSLCLVVGPQIVLLVLVHGMVFAYLALLTMIVFVSVGPMAFALYLSSVYLVWTIWAQIPRLVRD